MNAFKGLAESFVVSGQAAEAGGPGEAAFDHPAAGQQHETAFGLAVFDYFLLNAVSGRRLSGILAGVALVYIGRLDVVPGDLLHRLS